MIENNCRRIALLEESARLLYQEWFVHLKFPGYENSKIIEGVPQGWRLGTFGDIAEVKSGFAFKSKDWLDNGNPVIKIRNITDDFRININGCQCVADNVAEKALYYQISAGDLLIAMTGATIGKVGIMPRTSRGYFLNQRVGKFFLRSNKNQIPFLFCASMLKTFQSNILNLAGGAAQANISGVQIESIKILIPPESLMDWFADAVNPIFAQREVLIEQIQKLSEARDLLLPRLMNGEISV